MVHQLIISVVSTLKQASRNEIENNCPNVHYISFQTKVTKILGAEPNLVFAGANINLTITTDCLSLMDMESGDVSLLQFLSKRISCDFQLDYYGHSLLLIVSVSSRKKKNDFFIADDCSAPNARCLICIRRRSCKLN